MKRQLTHWKRLCIPTISLIALLATGSLFSITTLAQTNSIDVVFGDSGRRVTVGAFEEGEALYASLRDLAGALSLEIFENTAARKMEVKHAGTRLTVTGGNPYLIVVDQSGRRTTHQLSAEVAVAAGGLFVPLREALPFLDRVAGHASSLDISDRVIRIEGRPVSDAFDIRTVILEPKINGLVIRVPSGRQLDEFESWLRQDGWLYVTISDARADTLAINRLKPAGIVKKIIAIQSPGSVQLTFKLSGKIAASEILRDEHSNDVLISIRTHGNEDRVLLEKKRREMQADLESQRKRWKLDVIVIDAGHGGHDTGTIGVGGTREKDITLKIALKLGKLLEKRLKDVKVIYTRKDDRFVELDRRGQIANESNGKLFISIHCNSLRKKPSITRGFEVYLLRPGRTQEAIEIAERENAVIELEEGYQNKYKELNEENFILVTMAQSAYLKASEVFADLLQEELEDGLPIPNRGIRQAGFYVLVGAAMPNVLVETAYLSNREDERFLKSDAGQQKIAESVLKSIQRYKAEYEKLLLEGKDIGFK